MKRDQLQKALFKYYDTYQYHLLAYPKAAKSERVRKKWMNRFGGGLSLAIMQPSPLASLIPKNTFQGGTVSIPLFYGRED